VQYTTDEEELDRRLTARKKRKASVDEGIADSGLKRKPARDDDDSGEWRLTKREEEPRRKM